MPSARASFVVVAVGVSASLHLGKLPPAVPALQQALGIDLVEAGFLLSLMQVAGMCLGVLAGLGADAVGLRRSMLCGALLLSGASVVGGLAAQSTHAFAILLACRALEGIGFLMTVTPGPALIRRLAPPGAEQKALGWWGAYMPLGVALALLAGPAFIAGFGWPAWWWAVAAMSAAAAAALASTVTADGARTPPGFDRPAGPQRFAVLWQTLSGAGPQTAALCFAVYAAQWIAVIGFLPTIYIQAGVSGSSTALMTAGAAASNIVGNVVGGRLLQRGWLPAHLLRIGFLAMAAGSVAAYAQWGTGADAVGLPPAWRYAAVCLFSLCGGVIPATLFTLANRLSTNGKAVSTTVGFMQQASSWGQFLAPPAVAWLAHRVGGWQWTWSFTCACSLVGLAMVWRLQGLLEGRGRS